MTMGARQSACIVGYRVDFQRTKSIMQQGNRFKIIFTTEYTEDTEFRFF